MGYVFVDDLKLAEGDSVIYLHRFIDENGEEWEEEENCILDYYIDDNKINLKRKNNKYVWATKRDIVGKLREPFFSKSKINQLNNQIDKINKSIDKLNSELEQADSKQKDKINKQIDKLNIKKSTLDKTLKEGTEPTQIWIIGYEPIE